jgi:dTDP-4-amino-4,6-dideoxygalactose transaminase
MLLRVYRMIPFNKPPLTGREREFVLDSMYSGKISGDGDYTKKCHRWFERELGCRKALLTTSCTHALEMAAMLLDIQHGDEVIMPSYTFVSTANAFVLRGARVVFIDIRPDTMNLDETLIEHAITTRTKAIVPVHYAGVACNMDAIMQIAKKYGLYVVEDAAQGMMATYKGLPLGTIGHLGAYSFHETKNYTSAGEGGLLIINDDRFTERAEIIREKGTNRSLFFRGKVDKYSWVDVGSSYLPNDVSAAFLWGQLLDSKKIRNRRLSICGQYRTGLAGLMTTRNIELPAVPDSAQQNGHMFYLKARDIDERTKLIDYLMSQGVMAVFHYVPLHSSKAGKLYGRFESEDQCTTRESERLVRLPLFYNMKDSEVMRVIDAVNDFYK